LFIFINKNQHAIVFLYLDDAITRIWIKPNGGFRFINGSFPLTTCGCKIKTSNDAGFYFTLTYQQLSKWFNPISDTVDVYATVWRD